MKHWHTLLLLLLMALPAYGQSVEDADADTLEIEKFTRTIGLGEQMTVYGQFDSRYAPSAEASAIMHSSATPISLFTGVPNISIPIYTIETGSYKLPIGLNYRASGIKVAQEASRVGLGWSLLAGGAISRTVLGEDDLLSDGGRDGSALWGDSISVSDEVDIFSYNFGSFSGKFYVKFLKGQHIVKSHIPRLHTLTDTLEVAADSFLLSQPEDNLRIAYDKASDAFTVISPDNIRYTFAEKEVVQKRVVVGEVSGKAMFVDGVAPDKNLTMASQRDANFLPQFADSTAVTTSWYLSRIDMPTGDSIVFKYNVLYNAYVSPVRINRTVWNANCERESDLALYRSHTPKDMEVQTIERTNRQPELQEIVWKMGRVVFTPASAQRSDIRTYKSDYTKPHALAAIDVYTAAGERVQGFQLHQSYFVGQNVATKSSSSHVPYLCDRLRLDSLTIVGRAAKRMSYTFDYETDEALPAKNAPYTDRWGYYTGVNKNVYPFDLQSGDRLYSDRFTKLKCKEYAHEKLPDFPQPTLSARAWTLKSWTSPTGGTTTFEYGNNVVGDKNRALPIDTTEIVLVKNFLTSQLDTIVAIPPTHKGQLLVTCTYMPAPSLEPLFPVPNEEGELDGETIEQQTLLYQVNKLQQKGIPLNAEKKDLGNGKSSYTFMRAQKVSDIDSLRISMRTVADATLTLKIRLIRTQNDSIGVGGLRVERIHEPTGTRTFQYADGKLLRDPISAVQTSVYIPMGTSYEKCGYVEYHTAPFQPFENPYNDQAVGYGKVTEVKSSATAVHAETSTFFTKQERFNKKDSKGQLIPLNGKMLKQEFFANNRLVSKDTCLYKQTDVAKITEFEVVNHKEKSRFDVVCSFVPLIKDTNQQWADSENPQAQQTTETFYGYDEKYYLPTEITVRCDTAQTVSTRLTYSATVTDTAVWKNNYYINLPVEQTNLFNGVPYQRKVLIYSQDSLAHLRKEFNFVNRKENPWPASLGLDYVGDVPLDSIRYLPTIWDVTPDISYTAYDSGGRCTEMRTRMGQTKVQIWGYNHQYLIASIANASLLEVIGQGVPVEHIAHKAVPSEEDWALLRSLRTKLPKAAVTVYQYAPLVGVSHVYLPNGTEMRYTYDEFNRLQDEILWENGAEHVVKHYDYHYATEY